MAITVVGISVSTIEAVPPLDSQFIYDISEVILIGRVTSVNSTFSPTHNLYQIQVEKFLKNKLDTDTVLAAGQNTVITKLGNQVFKPGDRVLFFLNNDTINYDKYTGIFGVSYESKLVELQWDQCNIFEKNIPAKHWIFGGRGPMPKISQQNNTDTENFVVGKKVLITYDIFNHTPDEKNIDVGIQIKNLDDPDSLYIYTEISPHLLKACTAYETLSWNFTPTKSGRYSVEFYDLRGSQMTIGFTAREQVVPKSQYVASPLKQLTSGIPLDKIQCKEGLELILKLFDDSPACVSPETKQLLIERGWAKSSRSISKEFSHTLDGESKGSFDIHGSVDGARLSEISFDEHLNQLTIELEESQDGQLTITVPRELFKTDLGNDPDFMVIIDKEESTYSENKANTDSTLSISFPTKTKEIWIIGTYPVSYHKLPDDAVLQVTADAPCAWMTLQQLPHSELLKQHDRTGRNALMLEINDDGIGKVPHLKEMITALQSESGFEPYEYDENTWQKRITSTESEQQQIWDWLKETSDSQFGQLSDHSFTTYFTYQDKFYHIIWALC